MSKPVTRSIVALLLLSFPAAVFAQAPDANDPDFQEIRAYRLTMPTMNKVMQVAHDLSAAAEQRSSRDGKNVHTLSEMVEQIKSEAVVASILARAGLDAREFAKFTVAAFQAGMVAGLLKAGVVKQVPLELASTVNMANVKFLLDHGAEYEAFAKAMGNNK
jgi:hypothetical protein